MSRTKLAAIVNFARDRLSERSTRLAITGVLTSIGLAAYGAHIETISAVVALVAVILAPDAA